MQFKRDTDYAMRIVDCLIGNADEEGMGIKDISGKTQIPRIIVQRLCDTLVERGVISCIRKTAEAPKFYITQNNYKISLWDIVEAIEHQSDIFAVFDRNSEMYIRNEKWLQEASIQIDDCLKSLTIEKFLNAHDVISTERQENSCV